MKEKTDVLQGTLALMVLKTLDVLGPLHGYGIARRIEQISGDLLSVNQGTLYPVLLKLEQEGSIASEWGASENNRKARFYRLTRDGRKQLQAETRGLGADRGHHRAILCGESGGSEMRASQAILQAAELLGDEPGKTKSDCGRRLKNISRMQTAENLRAGLSPVEARRQAVLKFGAVEAIKEDYRDQKRTAVCGNAGARYAPRAAPLAKGAGVHHHHDADAGAGHWRDHFDFYFGARRSVEVAGGGESRRLIPPGKGNPLLLRGRIQPGQRVLSCLLRFVQILPRQHQRFCGIGGVSGR